MKLIKELTGQTVGKKHVNIMLLLALLQAYLPSPALIFLSHVSHFFGIYTFGVCKAAVSSS